MTENFSDAERTKNRQCGALPKIVVLMGIALAVATAPFKTALPEESSELRTLLGQALSMDGADVQKVAAALAATPAAFGDTHLTRWERKEVTLGMQMSAGASAHLAKRILEHVTQSFTSVGKTLDTCLLNDMPVGYDDADLNLSPCGPESTDIVLVLDTSPTGIVDSYGSYSIPEGMAGDQLRQYWKKAETTVRDRPYKNLCSGNYSSDNGVTQIAGATALIRFGEVASSVEVEEFVEKCSQFIGYLLLGSAPIQTSGSKNPGFSDSLLQLLYLSDFRGGESRADVLAKLNAARSN